MSDRSEQPEQSGTSVSVRVKALTSRAILLGGVVLVLVACGVVTLLLVAGSGPNQLNAIRTGGTLVVGAGGAVALLLAARRQRTTELELDQKYQAAADLRIDATERRITELYIKAADQLGSDKAPVRLAGLYALERLAQDTPRLRQTIVNLICAYLRMPYRLPPSGRTHRPLGRRRKLRPGQAISKTPTPELGFSPEVDSVREEGEVRLTAQSILSHHLKPGEDPDRPVDTFWDGIDLDLKRATLLGCLLPGCHIRHAWFYRAKFVGLSSFIGTTFAGMARFDGAVFEEPAIFDRAEFFRAAVFSGAKFADDASFNGAKFHRFTSFRDVRFTRAEFDHVEFVEEVPQEVARLMTGTESTDSPREIPPETAISS